MDNEKINKLSHQAIVLLEELIKIKSFSKEEEGTASLLSNFLITHSINFKRSDNNLICYNKFFDTSKKTILLNSHHDTVKPNDSYTLNPFIPISKDGKLFGLGSTDAGASVVSLLATFIYFNEQQNLSYNLMLTLTAEEENSGAKGIESILAQLPSNIYFAIVGEPTDMNLAIAEKGLMVLDCESIGKAGHAALLQGTINSILLAMDDIVWFSNFKFPKTSKYLGEVKMSVTIINAGTQHNVVPAKCNFTVDIRTNELYTFEEILETIRRHVKCNIKPRSMRLKSSIMNENHSIVKAGVHLSKIIYGSHTMSDKALIPYPTLKCGPGNSAQSHIADEFVLIENIYDGIKIYIKMLEIIFNNKTE